MPDQWVAVVTQTRYMYEEAQDHTSEHFRNTKVLQWTEEGGVVFTSNLDN